MKITLPFLSFFISTLAMAELTLDTPEHHFNVGRKLTLNGYGFNQLPVDDISSSFFEAASNSDDPILEIGSGFADASRIALEKGAREVWVNDLDFRHLMEFTSSLPQDLAKRVFLVPGDISVARLPSERFGNILAARVLQHLTPEQCEKTIDVMFHALKPGGSIFVINTAPYLKNFAPFIPVFEARKESGDLWPGFVKNITDYYTGDLKSWDNVKLPEHMNYTDPETLKRAFEAAGFEIIRCEFQKDTAPLPDTVKYDGREVTALIARKPH